LSALGFGIGLAEHGWVPDPIIRLIIRRMLRQRLSAIDAARADIGYNRRFAAEMAEAPIARVPERANEQHYEVPAEFFAEVLGRYRKYSSCLYTETISALDDAERAALAETAEHAALVDGQDVLELGCGWGSLTLWIASHYPASRVTAVSNSASQREFIEKQARERGLGNLTMVTCDMNEYQPAKSYDRIVSVEMFEHMSNWHELLRRVGGWLRDDGRLFIHIFNHRSTPYHFLEEGAGNWMGRYFFSGGIMPSRRLIECFGDMFGIVERWDWNGRHYARTAEGWLRNLDCNKHAVMPVLRETYGAADAVVWFNRWRLFFLAVAELFAFNRGEEWGVSHYLLEKAGTTTR